MLKTIALLITVLYFLAGCLGPTMFFGGVASAGATLSKEKSVGSTVDDHSIWSKIKSAFLQHHKEVEGILSNISVEVSEGRVLLTGFVKTPEERLTILKLVWKQNGVREVINEIKLSEETKQSNFSQYSSDTWITTKVKSKMFMNNYVRTINFNIETIDSTVYILGIARNQEELDAITQIVNNVKGVSKFVSYIRINNKKPKEDSKITNNTEQHLSEPTKETLTEEKIYPNPQEKPTAKQEVEEEEIEIEYLDSDD